MREKSLGTEALGNCGSSLTLHLGVTKSLDSLYFYHSESPQVSSDQSRHRQKISRGTLFKNVTMKKKYPSHGISKLMTHVPEVTDRLWMARSRAGQGLQLLENSIPSPSCHSSDVQELKSPVSHGSKVIHWP